MITYIKDINSIQTNILTYFTSKGMIQFTLDIQPSFITIHLFKDTDFIDTKSIYIKIQNDKNKTIIKKLQSYGIPISLGKIIDTTITSFIIQQSPEEFLTVLKLYGEI